MGGCVARDKGPNLDGLPEEEKTVFVSECQLLLNTVDFETFQGAVKRFGYKIDLNDEHMKNISKEIKLDVNEMNSSPQSHFAIVYKDENKFFTNKRHNVPKLLRLGFLLCRHFSGES